MTMHFSSFFVIFGANHIKNSAEIRTKHRCGIATGTLCLVLEFCYTVSPCPQHQRAYLCPLASFLRFLFKSRPQPYPAAVPAHRAPVVAGDDGDDARRIRLTTAGGFLHFQNAKTGRPAGRSDPDLRAAGASRSLIHIPS